MLKIGLTGGIASGKSTVAAEFARLGVPVLDADVMARELTTPESPGLKQLVAMLGAQILDARGHLDRARLRRRLFADTAFRTQVERLLHPLILQRLKDRLAAVEASYALAVIPLLVENPDAGNLVDRILVVDCPESLQITRLTARDGETAESARTLLAAQAHRSRRLAAGDDILINTGSLAELAGSVAKLHRFYLDMAGNPMANHPAAGLS
ncbi:MAG: dephospho-CoA kinase [Gammaproteobacteria bacterium]